MQYDNDLAHEALFHLKAGNRELARRYAERALLAVDDSETKVKAYFVLSQTIDDPKEKRECLEHVLANDPAHAEARRALAILDGKLRPADIVDTNNLPPQQEGEQKAGADRFMCPKCGARRVFAPNGVSLVCEHCGNQDSLANTGEVSESDFFVVMATARGHRKPVATLVFHCNGCGAEFVLAPGVISSTCSYCDSPHVVRLDESRDLLEPDAILPYGITQKQAVQKLVSWVNLYKVKPSHKVDLPRPLYIPLWTFDLGGVITYSGEKVEMVEDENPISWSHKFKKMQVVRVNEQYPVLVNDIPIPASRKTTNILKAILPTFDLSLLKPYDPRYLANWPAEIYEISMSDASLEARAIAVKQYIKQTASAYSHLKNFKASSAGMTVESFKLVLLPIYLTEIHFQGENHPILINGQNGNIRDQLQTCE